MALEIEEFYDDVDSVPDDVMIYRRVDWDKVGGKDRTPKGREATINGNCFTDYPDAKARQLGLPGACMSVGIGPVIEAYGYTPVVMLENYGGYGLAWLRVGDLRRLTRLNGEPCPQGIMPCPTEREPWHGVVFDKARRPRQKPVCKAIASVAEWHIALINHD